MEEAELFSWVGWWYLIVCPKGPTLVVTAGGLIDGHAEYCKFNVGVESSDIFSLSHLANSQYLYECHNITYPIYSDPDYPYP